MTQEESESEVIVYGLVCLDILWRVPSLPPLGGAVRTLKERKVIGGATGEAKSLPAYPPVEVIDTTGAGDVFQAGMIYGHLPGWDLIESARFASAAAALNCGALGGWAGVPSAKEIREFQHKAAR